MKIVGIISEFIKATVLECVRGARIQENAKQLMKGPNCGRNSAQSFRLAEKRLSGCE